MSIFYSICCDKLKRIPVVILVVNDNERMNRLIVKIVECLVLLCNP